MLILTITSHLLAFTAGVAANQTAHTRRRIDLFVGLVISAAAIVVAIVQAAP